MKYIWALASAFAFAAPAAAQAPVAVVEDVQGKVADVQFMDYVTPGKVIRLGTKGSVVLGYMTSCWRETITGGTVIVGAEESRVHLGSVERVKVDCDPSGMTLTEGQANQSAATVFRSMSPAERAATRPQITLYALSPVIAVKGRGTLVVERLDVEGERHQVDIGPKSLVRGKFYDFAKADKALTPGATYLATFGARRLVFKVDARALPGSAPIVGRLLRLDHAR